jgi:hypothetical protein
MRLVFKSFDAGFTTNLQRLARCSKRFESEVTLMHRKHVHAHTNDQELSKQHITASVDHILELAANATSAYQGQFNYTST